MAQRPRARDYRLEEQRRNARARELGFTSRAQMRRALRTGEWTPQRKSDRPRSPIVGSASPLPASVSNIARLRRESRDWSRKHSRIETSQYNTHWPDETVRAYHAAFVDESTRAWKIENGLESLREFLVDERGYYTDDEFDERYGVSSHVFS